MSSSQENVHEKMKSSNCGISLSNGNNFNNYNNSDQIRMTSSELNHFSHHTHLQPLNPFPHPFEMTSSSPSIQRGTTATITTSSITNTNGVTTASRQVTETPDIFKELPKMSCNTLNNYQSSCLVRRIETDDTSNVTRNVQSVIDHSNSTDIVKEVSPPRPPPLPLLPSSSSISSSTNSDNTLTRGSSLSSSDNNYPLTDRELLMHSISCGHQHEPHMHYGIPGPTNHECHHYPYQDVHYTTDGQRLTQLTNNSCSHRTLKQIGACLSSSSSRGGNFPRSYSSSSQLSSSDYGSSTTGPTCPNLSIYSPLSVYTEDIESQCLDNNYIKSKFSESNCHHSPIETILDPNQYQLPPSRQGSEFSHSIYGDTHYPSHGLRTQFGDQNTILDSYATIQRLKEPSLMSLPSLILSPRVVIEEEGTWNQIGTSSNSDTIQQQYLKHKSNIEKQCAKDSEKIKAKMSHKSSSLSQLEKKRKRRRGKCIQNDSSSQSWIVHLLASCPFICFLIQGKGRRHKVLSSFPGTGEQEQLDGEDGRPEQQESGESLTVLDASGRNPFRTEMTGNENDDEEEDECFDLSSNCYFSPSDVKHLEGKRKKKSRKEEIEDENSSNKRKKDTVEYLEVKQTESNNFLPNVSFNSSISSNDCDQSRDEDGSGHSRRNRNGTLHCKSKYVSWRTFLRLSLFTLLTFFTLLIFNHFVYPTFTIYELFSSGHLSNPNDHYGDVNGLNPSERWWKEGIFYEIFPPSFKDSNSDGIGDMNGIREKLSYLKSDLGVTGIRLNSIFRALDYPFQYDHVIDFKSIDPHLGTLDDFVQLVREAHQLDMSIILDINPVMTSDQHPWATQWLLNKSLSSNDFSSFYTSNPKTDKPLDVTSSTAIDRETVRDLEEVHISFGGHLYLNWSSPGVQSNMMQVFDYWINLGVDGFYLKNLHMIQVSSPETILNILQNLRRLLLSPVSRTSHSDHDRSSASSYLLSSLSSSSSVRREKRDSSLGTKQEESTQNETFSIRTEKISKQEGEENLKNFSVEIDVGFDEGLEGGRYISQSNHSSFFEERDILEEEKDAGDLKRRNEENGKEESEMTDEKKRRKVVKKRSGEEKQRRTVRGQERKDEGMPSRILMASKYSLDLLSDQIRKHFELKYFSSVRSLFPKHTLPKLKAGGKGDLARERLDEEDEEESGREKQRRGMKGRMFDGKQKGLESKENVRTEYEEEGAQEVEPDLNSMKEQRKGKERKKEILKVTRRKREEVDERRRKSSSNQAQMDEDVSTHNNILQPISGGERSKIDDHQGIHLEFYGNKLQKQEMSGKKSMAGRSGFRNEQQEEKSTSVGYASQVEYTNERTVENDDSKSYIQDDGYANVHDLDQVLMRQTLSGMTLEDSEVMQLDDGSLRSYKHNNKISMKDDEENKNNIQTTTRTTSHRSIYTFFDLVDVFLDIQLNQTESIRDQINSVYINEPHSHPWVNWNIGSSITSRLATRIGSNATLASMFLLIMLPGSVTIFYGDEIALKNSISPDTNKEYRGGQLVPMSWSTSLYGNFTNNKTTSTNTMMSGSYSLPWIPMNLDCITNNVQMKQESSIKSLSSLISFRKTYFKQENSIGGGMGARGGNTLIEKRGNYLFHYIHDGELVLERYFSRRKKPSSLSSSFSSYFKKKKRRRRWNERMEKGNYDNGWIDGGRMKRSVNNINFKKRTNNNNSNISPSNSQEGFCNNSTMICLSKILSNNSSRSLKNLNRTSNVNNNDAVTTKSTTISNNDKDNYKVRLSHFSSPLPSSSFLTEESPLSEKDTVFIEGKEKGKLIGEENESFVRTNKNGNENENKMDSVMKMEETSTQHSSGFSSKENGRTRNQNDLVIALRKNGMIEGKTGEKEEKPEEVQQMMMTKTRVGIKEEERNEKEEEEQERAVTAIKNWSTRKGIKQQESKSGRKIASKGEHNAKTETYKERFDRQTIWDRKDGRKAEVTMIEEKVGDFSGQKVVTVNSTAEDDLEQQEIGTDEEKKRENSHEMEQTKEVEDGGDEVVIATMVELPKVSSQEKELYKGNTENDVIGKEDDDTKGFLALEADEDELGQSSTIIGKSLGRPSTSLYSSSLASSISSPLSSDGDEEDEETVVRSRFVLFANLASSMVRIKDLRDKFHSGSIKVTSNPRRIRDFLYFRSLKLDPGEALIAQVE